MKLLAVVPVVLATLVGCEPPAREMASPPRDMTPPPLTMDAGAPSAPSAPPHPHAPSSPAPSVSAQPGDTQL